MKAFWMLVSVVMLVALQLGECPLANSSRHTSLYPGSVVSRAGQRGIGPIVPATLVWMG
jgi:hypothetical protein